MPIVPQDEQDKKRPAFPDAEPLHEPNRDPALELSERLGRVVAPDRAARIINMRRRTGISDEDMLDRNLDEIERDVATPTFDATWYRKFSPKMAGWLAESPNHVAVASADIKEGKLPDLEKVYWRKDNPARPLTKVEREGMASRAADRERYGYFGRSLQPRDGTEDKENLEARKQVHLRVIQAEEDFVAGKDPVGFLESWGRRFKENPWHLVFVAGDAVDFAKAKELYDVAKRIEKGEGDDFDRDYMTRWVRLNDAAERRGTSVMGKVSGILQDAPAFMESFIVTGGSYASAKIAIEKTIMGAAKKVLGGVAGRVARNAVGTLGASAVQTVPVMGLRAATDTAQRMTPKFDVTPEEEGEFNLALREKGEELLPALGKALPSAYIQTLSERLGGPMGKFQGAIEKSLFGKWMAKFPKSDAMEFVGKLRDKAGWNGILGEIFEERAADVLEAAAQVRPFQWPSADQWAAEILGFGVMGAGMAAPGVVAGALKKQEKPPPPTSDPETFERINEVMTDSAIATAAPEIRDELADRMGGNQPAYVNARTLQSYFQGKRDEKGNPLDDRAWVEKLNVKPEEYARAIENGTDIATTKALYAKVIATTEHAQALAQEFKEDPRDMTPREAKARLEEEKKTAETLAKDDEMAVAVRREVERRLVAAGYTNEQAGAYSKVIEAFYGRGLLKRAGAKAQELFRQKYTPQITTEGAQAAPATTAAPEALGTTQAEGKAVEGQLPTPEALAGRLEGMAIPIPRGALPVAAQTYEQPGQRGGYTPPEFTGSEALINLTRAKDLSTFIHESGHLFLDVFEKLAADPTVPPQVAQDFQTLLKWFGVKDLAAWQALSFEEKRPYHEKFAEAFERYALTGKAPSKELVGAFEKFKAWLTAIYASMKQMLLPIPKDVSDVMDRMLASDSEIEAQESASETRPLMADILAFGASEEAAARHLAAMSDVSADRRARLLAALMRDLQKKKTEEYVERRKIVREQVEKAVDALPVVKALGQLQRRGGPKIDKAALVAMIGAERVRNLPRPAIASEGGLPPDVVASALGFKNAFALIQEIETVAAMAPGSREADLRAQLGAIEGLRETLEAAQEPAKAEGEAAAAELTEEARAGRAKVERQILRTLKRAIDASVADVRDQLNRVLDAGGLHSTLPELQKRIPVSYRGKLALDVAAEDAFRAGWIREPDGEVFLDWLEGALSTIKDAGARKEAAEGEAKKLARSRLAGRIEKIAENAAQQERLREEIATVREEEKRIGAEAAAERVGIRHAMIERETDAQMDELYSDVARDPAALYDEAEKAMASESASEAMRADLEHLRSQDFAKWAKLDKAIARPLPPIREIRENARKGVGGVEVGKLDAAVYARAADRAARDSMALFHKGDYQGAYDAKMRQLLNHELALAAVKAGDEIVDAQDEFRDVMRGDADLSKRRDMGVVNAARRLLAAYGVITERQRLAAEEYGLRVTENDPALKDYLDGMIEPLLANAVPLTEASVDQFRALRSAVQSLWELSLASKQVEINGKKMAVEDAAEPLIAALERVTRATTQAGRPTSGGDQQVRQLLNGRAALRRVESWSDAIGEDALTYIFRPVSQASSKYRAEKVKWVKTWHGLLKKYEDKLQLNHAPIHAEEFAGTRLETLTKLQILHAIGHMGNESNARKFLVGYGVGTVDEEGNLDTSRWDAFKARMIREGVVTKADYDFMRGVWDYLEELKPDAQKAHRYIYGRYFNEVTAWPVETPWGTYPGGYLPAIIDSVAVPEMALKNEREITERQDNGYAWPSTNDGFTKARKEGYAKPLVLDLTYITQHVDRVLRFSHILPHVRDVAKILHHKGVQKALADYDPGAYQHMLMPWLQRSAQQMVEQPMANALLARFLRRIRQNTGMAIMAGNVVNALQNLTGLTVAALKVKPRHLRDALFRYMQDPKGMTEAMREMDPFMATRSHQQISHLQNEADEIALGAGPVAKAAHWTRENSYFMQLLTQNMVDTVVWGGAFAQAVEEGKSDAEAIEAAGSAVRLTQGSGNPEDLSRWETGNAAARLVTMFGSYFNMKANLLGTETAKLWRGELGAPEAARLAGVWTLGMFLPAALASLIAKALYGSLFDDDDDDGYFDTAIDVLFISQVQDGMAMLPGGNIVMRPLINSFNEKVFDDQMQVSPALTVLERGLKTPATVGSSIFGEGGKRKAVVDALTLLGLLTGLPGGGVARPIGYAVGVADEEIEPESGADFIRGLATGRK